MPHASARDQIGRYSCAGRRRIGLRVERLYGEAAILRYRVRIEINFGGAHEEGTYWHTDAYELRDDRWQAVWSQATRIREQG